MALISAVALFLAGILGAAFSRQLADDFKAWVPWITRRLVVRAVAKLPEHERARFQEEWLGHISEVPGELGRLFVAISLLSAARKMAAILAPQRTRGAPGGVRRALDIGCGMTMLVFCVPIMALLVLTFRLKGVPAFTVQNWMRQDGREVKLYRFNTEGSLGRVLLRTSMDFLPMLINVARGDISLVAPKIR